MSSETPEVTADGPVLVTGGTGTLGRAVVRRLLDGGHPARVLSRRPRPDGDEAAYEWATGDLNTGEGVDAAVAGCRAVVHCATTMSSKDIGATAQLVGSARRNGSPHLVYISIVGINRVPFFYYRAKLAAERIVEGSDLPWTILRTTQFHDLVARITTSQFRLPVTFFLAGVRFQPVDEGEVAERLVGLALRPASGRAEDMGGPEVRTSRELTVQTLAAYGRRRLLLPLRLPGKAFRGFRAGGHLSPSHATGRITYPEYLSAAAGREGRRAT